MHASTSWDDVADIFRATFIAPCSGGGHRWYIFHQPSQRRAEKVNIKPSSYPPKKCVQVSSSSSGHANNLDVRGNRSFDVGNKTTRGRTVYPLCLWLISLKGWWILDGQVREPSLTMMWKTECCQGTSLRPQSSVRGHGTESSARWSARTRSSLFGLHGNILDLNFSFLPSKTMNHYSFMEGTKLTTSLIAEQSTFP